jgi:transcriptional regulator with XRE-family HTH domain
MSDRIGLKIRLARVQAELTQKQLATLIHCDQTTVSNWETGRYHPDVTVLGAIEEVTGIKICAETV